MSTMPSFMVTFTKKSTCAFLLVLDERGRLEFANSINPYMGLNKLQDNGMQNSLPLLLMQDINNPRPTIHYSSDPTKVTSQLFSYM
jgi:hypothetical protein